MVPQRRDVSAARPTYRPEIQGLRALAVSLVVIYHLWPAQLPGGYLGVDAFFAISGFLITEQLLGELRREHRVSLLRFYGRRARRLLPAAALVLAVTWVASRLILPSTQLPEAADEIRASALYFQNWLLAHNAVDYLNATQAPSPVQHFWSLSVEEQFYLVWPLLFVLAGLLIRRSRAGYAVLGLLTAGIFAGSLYASITATAADPASAYFTTTTRMWELAAGGLLALAGPRVRRFLGREGVLGWIGLGLVVAGAFVLTDDSPFPGWLALMPVGGTVLLLTAGSSPARFGPGLVLNHRPLIVLGGISYGVYLWHWPLIILWKAYWGTSRIGLPAGLGLIAATVLLAALMKVLLEDPVRLRPFIARYRWRSLATASAVVVPVALVTAFIHGQPPAWHGGVDRKHPGGAVLADGGRTVPQARAVPPVDSAKHDEPNTDGDTCLLAETATGTHECTFGDTDHPKLTVALVGDSMAAQWLTGLEEIADRRHWKVVTELHSRCPFSAAMTIDRPGHDYRVCHDWGEQAQHELLTGIKPDVVITSDRPNLGTPDHPHAGSDSFAQIGGGMEKYWKQLLRKGIKVVPIRESPEMGHNVPDCLASRTGSRSSCAVKKSDAIVSDPPIVVATRKLRGQVELVDMNSLICGSTTCKPVVGNVSIYRDSHHLTNTYVKTIAPYLEQRLLATHALHRIG